MRELPAETDVLIIGAGPAGSIAASILAEEGFRVTAVEKQWFPRHVIGESLLPRCNQLLHEAGLLEAVERRGYMPKHAALFVMEGRRERFPFANSLSGDWASSFQVPRDDFDQTLASAARAKGVDLRHGVGITGLSFEEGAAIAAWKSDDGEGSLRARFVLDCSGPARVLPRLLGLDMPADILARSAVYTHVEGDLRPEGAEAGDIWIVVHPGGAWFWIIPFSNGRTSVGVVAEDAFFDTHAGDDTEKLWATLRSEADTAARLRGAVQVQPTRRLRGWTTATSRLCGPGWAVAGNAGDFLDPVFSSGVMFALESGSRAARLAARQMKGEAVDWQQDYEKPMQDAVAVFKGFVLAWYRGDLPKLFFSPVKPEDTIRSICSILGGNVFNQDNLFVSKGPDAAIESMMRGLRMLEASKAAR
ncbi:MAG TPA: NAD(P)/FAD-dependent oxidoreductase [Holophagaceae bacterium]|nr:NAD(P)/FAD-dependent oxidoreductase [Holophagaceae bacterium]